MFAQILPITLLDVIAIVLSIVSLIITVIGFFASLKFYRDGVNLQAKANDALTKLEEKTQFIQTQVGGMFDKTLDAAIGKRVMLSEQFEELNMQLDQTKSKIIEESLAQIGAAGEQERKRLTDVVNNQIDLIRKKLETTRESAEDIAQEVTQTPDSKTLSTILTLLAEEKSGLTEKEIAERLGWTESKTLRLLNWLYKSGRAGMGNGRFYNFTGTK